MDQIINHIKNFKEVVGLVGIIGTCVNFWAKLHPKYAVPVGIICALFILIWGLIERTNARPIIRTLAWVGIVVSIVAEVFFLCIGGVIALRSPTERGEVVQQVADELVLTRNQNDNQLSQVYSLKFARNATFVEIGIAPVPSDLAKVEILDVTPQGDRTITSKITELANKTSDLQTYYRFAEPTSSSSLNLLTIVTLKPSTSSSPIHIRVNHTYIDRDLLWGIRQWISRNFSW
jgi:hypothetical protein